MSPDIRSQWFARQVLPHEPKLRAWLHGRFPALGDMDDLVQESLARLLRAHATEPVLCAKAFLFVTARNLALNHLRHQRIERPNGIQELDLLTIMDEGIGVREAAAAAEDFEVLMRAIQALPDRCRQVVTLRKIYGLSQKEVASRLDISEHTVEAQGSIGMRKCVEFFQANGYDSIRFRRSPLLSDRAGIATSLGRPSIALGSADRGRRGRRCRGRAAASGGRDPCDVEHLAGRAVPARAPHPHAPIG